MVHMLSDYFMPAVFLPAYFVGVMALVFYELNLMYAVPSVNANTLDSWALGCYGMVSKPTSSSGA